MLRSALLILTSIGTLSVHAARLPKSAPNPTACDAFLIGQRIVVGSTAPGLEDIAKAAATDEFKRGAAAWFADHEAEPPFAALRLADGAALFVIDVSSPHDAPDDEPSTYAVRVSPEGATEVVPFDPKAMGQTKRMTAKIIASEALQAVAEEYPIDSSFPGVWAGGPPRVTGHAVVMNIPTGSYRGVALIEVTGESITLHTTRQYAVAEVRGGELHSLTDLESKGAETPVAPTAGIDAKTAETKAKDAAVQHLVISHVPEVYRPTIQLQIVDVARAGDGFNITIDRSFVTRGVSGLRESDRVIVNVTPEGKTRVEPEVAKAQAAPNPPRMVLTEEQAIKSVADQIKRLTPNAEVAEYSASPIDDRHEVFTVWAKIKKGPLRAKATIYQVSVGPHDEIVVTAVAAQG